MNYLFNIALKYLFGIRHKNVANIITLISLIGVLFGTMAMVVVLSVFNGFDDIINKLYNTIDTDFNPIEYSLKLGHALGLEIHAWINCYILWSAKTPPEDQNHILLTNPFVLI